MIEFLDENDFFIVVVKPAGVSCHNEHPSLVQELKKLNKPTHIVNRLDAETSGLILIAKSPDFHMGLAESLSEGQKFYRALGRGRVKAPLELNSIRTLDWPLTDKAEGRRQPQGIKADQKNCLTLVTAVRSNNYFTEFRCELKTGRQHQIRKHLCLLEYPIVGDKRYNEPQYNQKIAKLYKDPRMHLHAEELNFSFKEKNYSYLSPYNLDLFFK